MKPDQLHVPLPEYQLGRELDYDALGRRVDDRIGEALPDGEYVVRAISSDDHEGMTQHDLLALILESGTDKYDVDRREVAHEDFHGYDHDFHGDWFAIENGRLKHDADSARTTVFGDIAFHFAEYAPLDRGYPVRIDLLIIYRADGVERASHVSPGAPRQPESLERHLYRFIDPENKVESLACVVNILR